MPRRLSSKAPEEVLRRKRPHRPANHTNTGPQCEIMSSANTPGRSVSDWIGTQETHSSHVTMNAALATQLQRDYGNTAARYLMQRTARSGVLVLRQAETAMRPASRQEGPGGGAKLRLEELNLGKELERPFGQLKLDLSLKAAAPILSQLLLPTPDLCQELAEKWANEWLTAKGLSKVAPQEPVLVQLVTALKGNVEKWTRKGPAYTFDPLRAEEAARLKQWQAILKRYKKVATAEPGKEEEALEKREEEQLEEIKDTVLDAFKKALESTRFYSRWKDNLEEVAKDNWPILAIVGGTAVGGLLAEAIKSGKWDTMETLSGLLPELADTDVEIDNHWRLMIAFKESPAIGKEGGGTVIGLSPYLGLRYTFDDGRTLEFFGNINLRLAPNAAGLFSLRTMGFFGVKGTF